MADYAQTSRDTAVATVAQRLGDASKNFYEDTELVATLTAALRVWNVLTVHDRARGSFPTSTGTVLYALPTVLADPVSTLLRQRTVTDAAVLTNIGYRLGETTATGQFTTAQQVRALERVRNDFLTRTGVHLTQGTAAVTASQPEVDLPESVVALRRVVFHGVSGRYSTVSPSSELLAEVLGGGSLREGMPRNYSVVSAAPLTIRLAPIPAESGTLEYVSVSSGASLDTTQVTPTLIGIPDDFTPFLEWGTIALLLADERSQDAERMTAASALYELGVVVAQNAVTVLHAMLDGRPVKVGTAAALDSIRNGWQAEDPGAPDTVAMVGPELVLVAGVPDSEPHNVTLDVARNMRVPSTGASKLQIPAEHLEGVYALAMWMCGFRDYEDSVQGELLSVALDAARSCAMRKFASSKAMSAMYLTAHRPQRDRPLEADSSEEVGTAPEDVAAERNARRRKTTLSGGGAV